MKRCKHWLFCNRNPYYVGVTTISALMAMEMSIKYKLKTLFITQEEPYRGASIMFAQQLQQLNRNTGFEYTAVPQDWHTLLRYSRTDFLNEDLLVSSTLSLFPSLDMMSMTYEDSIASRDVLEHEIQYVVDIIERCYDVVIWDNHVTSSIGTINRNDCPIIPHWLNNRDYAIADFLLQDQQLRQSTQQIFISNSRTQSGHLHMGLINMYDQRLLYNLSDVKRKFRHVPLFAIPYDYQLRSSIQEGSLLSYYLRLLYRHSNNEKASLMSSLSLLSRYFVSESALITKSWEGEQRWG